MSFMPISDADTTPLVLIHDISGSIFPYASLSMLPPLEKHTISGISAAPFQKPDSIHAWAHTYAALIADSLPPPPSSSTSTTATKPTGSPRTQVVLGGWSLGGLLAAEIARIFEGTQEYAHIAVLGVVLLDSHAPWHVHTRDMTSGAQNAAANGSELLANGTPYLSPGDIQAVYALLARSTRAEWPGLDGVRCPYWLITPTQDGANGMEEWFGEDRAGEVVRIAEGEEGCDHFSMMEDDWIEQVGEALAKVLDKVVL
ncbi:hypothetical protein SERLA73DRAFT_153693 [Serpula lacrymans var. lacrymans S7.3]|uniref:AB hydrolase-1 domain-containing protein n=2 Tax=Serpula lacrymans var. lacrymans TaxID=341189 RepID=F8Q207_SERL3|nr:uncharacterized protein SERLADRAFT_409379 [Serpula lacrymans var. lacrymans S7.9]EGN97218.1 hypothetical protein SERLA73DRAFT_153693 [Serpula lacrymans var. lacrymans S7.3]EGO22826.1 hypothetical protein SERLADRAFT_409379 [Serpula lacrymans var. lacrymans S7.9]